MKKFFNTIISFTLVFSFIANFGIAKADDQPKNKAMILVPGLFASGLFYRGEDCAKYYKNEAIWIPMDTNYKWRVAKGITKFELFNSDLGCDENGELLNKDIGVFKENESFPYEVDSNIAKYAVDGSGKNLIDTLTAKFPDRKVFMYNYDWRRDIEKAAEDLAQTIRQYDEVVLIGYSLGGIVSCKAAMKLKESGDLNKISKFISVAVPYNGTTQPFYVLNSGMYVGNDLRGKFIKFLGIHNIVKEIAKNCEIAFQMLPSEKYFERAEEGYLNKDGKVLNYSETLDFIRNCEFSKKSDGTVKAFLSNPQVLFESLVDKDGKHILNYLDYHLVVGCGVDTISKFDCNLSAPVVSKYVDGDGTVALKESAIPFDGIDSSKIFKVKASHQQVISDNRVVEDIVNVISGSNNTNEKIEKK